MSKLLLTEEEIQEITGKKRWSAQIRALRQLGIVTKSRPDGKPLVTRSHYLLEMGSSQAQNKDRNIEPDFGALYESQDT